MLTAATFLASVGVLYISIYMSDHALTWMTSRCAYMPRDVYPEVVWAFFMIPLAVLSLVISLISLICSRRSDLSASIAFWMGVVAVSISVVLAAWFSLSCPPVV